MLNMNDIANNNVGESSGLGITVFGWIMTSVGLILSAIAMRNKPRGLAISGLVISFVSIVCGIIIFAATAALFTEVAKEVAKDESLVDITKQVEKDLIELEQSFESLVDYGNSSVKIENSAETDIDSL